jgi:hypothetical protein
MGHVYGIFWHFRKNSWKYTNKQTKFEILGRCDKNNQKWWLPSVYNFKASPVSFSLASPSTEGQLRVTEDVAWGTKPACNR